MNKEWTVWHSSLGLIHVFHMECNVTLEFDDGVDLEYIVNSTKKHECEDCK